MNDEKMYRLSMLDSKLDAANGQARISTLAAVIGLVLLFLLPPLGVFILIVSLLSYFTAKARVNGLEREKLAIWQ